MCQCVVCNCWWFNLCGVCAGYHEAHICFSCWFCKTQELYAFDPFTCHCCQFVGCGNNCFCWGNVMCAPFYIKNWSDYIAGRRTNNVVVVAPPMSGRPFKLDSHISHMHDLHHFHLFYTKLWFKCLSLFEANEKSDPVVLQAMSTRNKPMLSILVV